MREQERRNERAKYSWILVGIGKRGEINEEERARDEKQERESAGKAVNVFK